MKAEENLTPMAFKFNATSQEIETFLYKNEAWIVAKDICEILELGNVTKALYGLDNDEKLTLPIVRAGQTRQTNLVNESGLYNLIFKSRKPEAKAFRKWVTSEVLPAIRKKGFFKIGSKQDDFIDARDVPHNVEVINNYVVTVVYLNEKLYLVNDLCRAIQSTTAANQIAKKLNAKRTLAIKVWLFGQTNPTWFTTELGKQLIFSGSRIESKRQQLLLPFSQKGGAHA